MAYFLPFRPWFPVTLGYSAQSRARFCFKPSLTSLALRCHPKRLAPSLAATNVSHVDHEPPEDCTSHKLSCSSAYPDEEVLFCASPFEKASGVRCPEIHKFRTRVWLPSLRFCNFPILGNFFSPQRS